MASRDENESEILLGNKQLLAVFAVVALLLAVAFTGGYVLGRGSADKKAAVAVAEPGEAPSPLTKMVTPDDQTTVKPDDGIAEAKQSLKQTASKPKALSVEPTHEIVLGAPKHVLPLPETVPQAGQTFIQVAALTHTQAEATADVLRKRDFHARIAMKPGTDLYRVLVGPVKDAGDLSTTRESLRKIGFREVLVQRYQ